MNRGEAAEVLDELCASYIRTELDDRTVAAWIEALVESGADFHAAGRMARTWARSNEWFPSLAQFLAAVRPREAFTADADRPPVHPDVSRRIAGMWGNSFDEVDKRAAGATRGVNGHWHGGPEPCPVCGGMKPR